MGWNSWNKFACHVDEQLIEATADAMVASGMRDAGYQYVIIDDCWQVSRDADGNIVADPAAFPHGMKALADYVHAKGLKFGIYTDAGTKTCEGRPGSLGHEEQDAQTYAAWGVDYVKFDWCNAARPRRAGRSTGRFHDALAADRAADRVQHLRVGQQPAVDVGRRRSATSGGRPGTSTTAATACRSWLPTARRCTRLAGPGRWNDPDMLEVGNGGMTDARIPRALHCGP